MRRKVSDDLIRRKKYSQIPFFKEEREKEREKYNNEKKENKILSKAYHKVINVITNILDDDKNDKKVRKPNLIKQKSIKTINSNVNKKPIHKMISHNRPKKVMFLSTFSSQLDDSSYSNLSKSKLIKKLDSDKKFVQSGKELINNNFKGIIDEDIKNEIQTKSKRKKYFQSDKRNGKGIIMLKSFFKPKNKLKHKFDFRKNTLKIEGEKEKAHYNSTIARRTNKDKNVNTTLSSIKSRSNIRPKSTKKNLNIYKDIEEPFNSIQQKLNLNIDTKRIQQRLYEYENNEITNQIDKLPEITTENKNIERKKDLVYNLKKLSLNPFRDNFIKNINQYNKENKYRCLLQKNSVYDSLDDEDNYDKYIQDSMYFKPDSIYLYILDSLIFIFSLIILFYLPIYLAKNLFFCKNLKNANSIIFYTIDIFYIIDLVINFYRSYYNFDENLITDKNIIFIHYMKTWFLLDFISSLPIYFFFRYRENECFGENNLNNNGKHSFRYNTNPHNIHYILMFVKAIKTYKAFKKNLAVEKIEKVLYDNEFFNQWIEVFLYAFFFFAFLNISSCFYIFLGRNTFESWIYLDGKEESSFSLIYLASIYYLVVTVTTVGYGDLIGRTIYEILFQIIMLLAGTCVYTWLISSVSTYVQKSNEKNIKYEGKIQILKEIKLNNPNLSEEIYLKILKLLYYRKFHEEETEKNIVLDSLPNTLKNNLLIEMYKTYINGFTFFKNIKNRDFIVQVISKLESIIGFKGEILIKEGEYVDDIIFIKNGVLSMEILVDMSNPQKSIKKYLINNGFLSKKDGKLTRVDTPLPKYLANNVNKKGKDNIKNLRILDIRKNEHFGDVFMFLHKKCPLNIKVKSRKADLLLLKKLDAIDLCTNYQDIWKIILKTPLANKKMITRLTIKRIKSFCNFYGIRSNFFKKRKKRQNFPNYNLNPISPKKFIKKSNSISQSIKSKNIEKIKKENQNLCNDNNKKINNNKKDAKIIYLEEGDDKEKEIRYNNKEQIFGLSSASNKEAIKRYSYNISNHFNTIENEMTYKNTFSLKNNTKSKYINNKDIKSKNQTKTSLYTFKNDDINCQNSDIYNNKNYINSLNNKKEILIKSPNLEKHSTEMKIDFNQGIFKNNKNNNKITNTEEEVLLKKHVHFSNEDNNLKKINNKSLNKELISTSSFNPEIINEEIYPGENFIIKTCDDDLKGKIINNINKLSQILSDNTYINNLNIYRSSCLSDKVVKINNFEISSESTIEIKSSYENINKITDYKYIKDDNLKEETKNFLISKCKKNIHYTINTDESIEKIHNEIINKKENSHKSSGNNNISSILSDTNIKKPENIKIGIINNFQKSINENKANENILKSFKTQIYVGGIDFSSRSRKDENKENEKQKRNIPPSKLNDNNKNNNIKKKKKKKDLDIISINLKKSSQNLNQPDIFYAGLFSELISKGGPDENV